MSTLDRIVVADTDDTVCVRVIGFALGWPDSDDSGSSGIAESSLWLRGTSVSIVSPMLPKVVFHAGGVAASMSGTDMRCGDVSVGSYVDTDVIS